MEESEKDIEQDEIIRSNSARIARNEMQIQRQTRVLEQIRDHFYPKPKKWWMKIGALIAKFVCLIFAYLGIAQTVDWIWNARESGSLAHRYAKVASRLYLVDGDVPGAISCLEKAVSINPGESEYGTMLTFLKGMALAREYLSNERPPTDVEHTRIDVALAEATVLNELQPRDPLPCILMAQAYLLSGEKEDAVKAVEQAVARAPKLAAVHVSACAVNYYAGRVADARRHFEVAERLDPSLLLVSVWKGLFKFRVDHDIAAARACFEALVARAPRFAAAHLYLGKVLLAEKDPDLKRVRAAFERALVLDARLISAMFGMAETYEREDRRILALLWLDRTLVIDPNYLPALVARARINVKNGNPRSAVTDLTAALALSPFRADLYRLRAAAHEKAGDAARASSDRRTADALASL